MPRPDFETSIPEHLYRNGVDELTCPDAKYCRETTVGVRRIKPTGAFIPPTFYTFNRERYDRHTGTLQYMRYFNGVVDVTGDTVTGCIGVGTGTGLESLAELHTVYSETGIPEAWFDKALIKARLAMKEQSVNLPLVAAESGKTARLLGDTAIKLAKAGRALIHKDIPGCARALGVGTPPRMPRGASIPEQWLEFQYGWKPLLQDVYGSAEALAKRDRSDWIITGKGSVKEKINVVNKITGAEGTYAYGVGTATGTKGIFIRIDAIPQNNPLHTMASLGVTNPGSIAWELVPFSFVVDWALPVGDFINSFDAMLGYDLAGCSASTFERFQVRHRLLSSSYSTEIIEGTYSHEWRRTGLARRDYVKLRRDVFTDVPLPLLPRMKDPASLTHMANGLSLLASVFGGRK